MPNSPSIPRAFSNLRQQLTSAWGGGGGGGGGHGHHGGGRQRGRHGGSKRGGGGGSDGTKPLKGEDKKKWNSSYDCGERPFYSLIESSIFQN